MLRSESDMARSVARYLRPAAREVRVGDCIFDVVAYDKKQNIFKLLECKTSTRTTSIGRAFGQIAAYYAALADRGREFINAVSKRLHLSFDKLMEATYGGRRMRIAFYLALTQEACRKTDLIRSIKELLPVVGIIRVKPDGKCRDHIHQQGKKDMELCMAKPTVIQILHGRDST